MIATLKLHLFLVFPTLHYKIRKQINSAIHCILATLATETGAGEAFLESAARIAGPVPGTRGVPRGVLEAVLLTVLQRRVALLPALLPALPLFPALVPALSRHSSPAPVSVANGFLTVSETDVPEGGTGAL